MDTEFKTINNEKTVLLIGETAFKFDKLQNGVHNYFGSQTRLNELYSAIQQSGLGNFTQDRNFFQMGVSCEILEPGSGDWAKGKVRLKFTLEFCPDAPPEPEVTESSPPNLDDIRQMNVE